MKSGIVLKRQNVYIQLFPNQREDCQLLFRCVKLPRCELTGKCRSPRNIGYGFMKRPQRMCFLEEPVLVAIESVIFMALPIVILFAIYCYRILQCVSKLFPASERCIKPSHIRSIEIPALDAAHHLYGTHPAGVLKWWNSAFFLSIDAGFELSSVCRREVHDQAKHEALQMIRLVCHEFILFQNVLSELSPQESGYQGSRLSSAIHL